MKFLFVIIFESLIFNLFSQEILFKGEVQYGVYNLNINGEYVIKGSSINHFCDSYYSYSTNISPNIIKLKTQLSESLIKKSKNDELQISDTFEINRIRKKIEKNNETTFLPLVTFVNLSKNILLTKRFINDDNFCVQDSLNGINWVLINDTLTIDGMLCQKAIGFFVDRIYDVWFTNSIPFDVGPWKMHGLPGLIVKAISQDKKKMYSYLKIDYPLKTIIKENICQNDSISVEKFDKMVKESSKNSKAQTKDILEFLKTN